MTHESAWMDARPAGDAAVWASPSQPGKRAMDLVLASALLLPAVPILLALALAIRLESPGPILFRQPRRGLHGRVFTLLKLRTMHAAAADPAGRRLARPGDPRVTRLGRTLRRLRLDELPQLWNVLRGEMSLVGPRPHAIGAQVAGVPYERAVPGYAARHAVRPGLTGLAQVTGHCGFTPTAASLAARVAQDLRYIDRWSPWLDVAILLRTPAALLAGERR